MDIVTDLPILTGWKKNSNDALFIIVDYLTKMIHYEPVKTTIDITSLAKVIINMIVTHHGLFESIINNQSLLFTSKF